VSTVTVDKPRSEAVVVRHRGLASGTELVEAVRRAGYRATVIPTLVTTIEVEDMTCGGCPERVKATLSRLGGVRAVTIPSEGEAVVYYDRRKVKPSDLVAALRRSGFECHAQG